jgi:adenine specific DNA methylase Mod
VCGIEVLKRSEDVPGQYKFAFIDELNSSAWGTFASFSLFLSSC